MRNLHEDQGQKAQQQKGHRVAWVEEELLHLYWYSQHPEFSGLGLRVPQTNLYNPGPMSIHIPRLPSMP